MWFVTNQSLEPLYRSTPNVVHCLQWACGWQRDELWYFNIYRRVLATNHLTSCLRVCQPHRQQEANVHKSPSQSDKSPLGLEEQQLWVELCTGWVPSLPYQIIVGFFTTTTVSSRYDCCKDKSCTGPQWASTRIPCTPQKLCWKLGKYRNKNRAHLLRNSRQACIQLTKHTAMHHTWGGQLFSLPL